MESSSKTQGVDVVAPTSTPIKDHATTKSFWGRSVKTGSSSNIKARISQNIKTMERFFSALAHKYENFVAAKRENISAVKPALRKLLRPGKPQDKSQVNEPLFKSNSDQWVDRSGQELDARQSAIRNRANKEGMCESLKKLLQNSAQSRNAIRKHGLSSEEAIAIHSLLASENIQDSMLEDDVYQESGQNPSDSILPLVSPANSGLDKLPEFRGITYSSATESQLADILIGGKFLVMNLTYSTKEKITDEDENVIFMIRSKHGREVKDLSNNRMQGEVVFKHGTYFVCDKKIETKDDKTVVHLREVDKDEEN